MEGHHQINSGSLLKLSEQQCVDCDPNSGGCNGGWQYYCMDYVKANGGISLEKDYPYAGRDQTCRGGTSSGVIVSMTNHVTRESESALLSAIA